VNDVWPSAIQVDAIDDVPLLWIDAPPPFRLFLMFRVGQADEELTNSGISHLVEHLAFPHDHSPDAPSNAATTLTNTVFYAWGDPDEAAAFIHRTAATLTRLPLERIDHQRSIILTEESSGAGGPAAELLSERYGARAHGVVGYRQLGLHRLTAADVSAWSLRHYTADNAILCATGPPPGRLALELPRGQRMPAPIGVPVDGPLPRWAAQNLPLIALGVLTDHEAAAGTAHRILERRLFRRLRQELAFSYAVRTSAEVIDPQTLHRSTVADSQRETAARVTRQVVETAEDLAAHGPTAQEVRDDLAVLERDLRNDPRAIGGWMMHAAECYLSGIEVEELDDYIETRRELTVGQVREAWAKAYTTAILIVPPWVEIGPRVMGYRRWPAQGPGAVRGVTFYPPGMGRIRKGPRATVGDEAIFLSAPGQPLRTIRFDQTAALLRTKPLTRVVIDVEGRALSVDASEFSNGHELVARLDHSIPGERWIDLLSHP
jgi:zinc protease